MRITIIHGQNHMGSTYHIGKLLAEQFVNSDIREFFLPKDLEHFVWDVISVLKMKKNVLFTTRKNGLWRLLKVQTC